jgi:uncharacterized membrane protein
MTSLSALDWLALAVFGLCWFGYTGVADNIRRIHRRSVMAAMDEHRRRWMLAMLRRDNRIADVATVGNLMQSVSFLATTSIFILGGLVAMLGAPDLGRRVVASLPYAAVPDEGTWEVKIALLILIFVNAFFALTWCLRLFNYCSIMIGAIVPGPPTDDCIAQAEAAARVASRAARHFTTGLRCYYFGLAALAWILHPLALVAASLLVLRELHRREFRSEAREAVAKQAR